MNGLDFLAQSNIRFDLKRQNASKLLDNLRQSRRNSALSFLLFVSGLTTVPASSTFIFNEKVLSHSHQLPRQNFGEVTGQSATCAPHPG